MTDFEANSAPALVKFSAGWVRAACPSSWRVTDGVLPTRADPLVRDGVVPCLDRDRPVDKLTRFLAWGMLPCLAFLLAALVPLKDALRTARETGTFSLLPPSTSPGMVLLYVLGPFALALPLALYRLLKAVTRAAQLWQPGVFRYKDIRSVKPAEAHHFTRKARRDTQKINGRTATEEENELIDAIYSPSPPSG